MQLQARCKKLNLNLKVSVTGKVAANTQMQHVYSPNKQKQALQKL